MDALGSGRWHHAGEWIGKEDAGEPGDAPDGGGDQGDARARTPPHLRLRRRDLPQPAEDPWRGAAGGLRRRPSFRLGAIFPRHSRRPDSYAPHTLRPALPPLPGRLAWRLDPTVTTSPLPSK